MATEETLMNWPYISTWTPPVDEWAVRANAANDALVIACDEYEALRDKVVHGDDFEPWRKEVEAARQRKTDAFKALQVVFADYKG